MESPLPEVPLFKVFSFLDVFDLLRAGQVSKYWNKVADSDRLWRNLCLKKWSFYNFPCEHLGTQTWKRFLLNQIRHEHQMELAQPEDFIYKKATGNLALQIASFLLPVHMESPIWMGVSDGNMIVFESGPYLFLFTINGLLLQQFDDHELTICNLWVDSLHVLTTSMDNYLHMYMWEEEGRYPYLKSCFHLEHIKNDYTPSCFFSKAICDNTSVVCVVSRSRETSILVMYSLNM
ncbi:PREDICTED: F-box/WD repeat-containing protein 12 [Hipposideros armiger]|uniref:F-box/WD repeat-containing protein 12 n=1 Tax=Hipposideros armiger TaxID=186990 RepID=A0A8B7QCE9_HIPAR|nr:PREDICTED: F-box/WD repeat-containing protein 12 [Hipposideros armiger]